LKRSWQRRQPPERARCTGRYSGASRDKPDIANPRNLFLQQRKIALQIEATPSIRIDDGGDKPHALQISASRHQTRHHGIG